MLAFNGQDRLLTKINTFTFDTLPKTLLLIGDKGCGKKTLARYIANKFDLAIIELSENFDTNLLIDIQQGVNQKLCIIDLDKFLEKQQNQFLKFIEEPSNTVHTVLTTSSEMNVLPTILNRCIKYYFEDYTTEFLKENFEKLVVHPNDLVYQVCKTPGQLLNVDGDNILKLFNCCKKLLSNITKISYPNLLKVSTLINYKDDYDRFEPNQFISALRQVAFDIYAEQPTECNFNIYITIVNKARLWATLPLVTENFIIDCLTSLWEVAR